ncbi:MAG: ROK family protein [Cyanobacteria bacterium NC_groundwater_1444_Ag_S-0.65um_54_12]|nr:ROK family protein [Cyanobacteria bacterium NC_groundwater_1444_Ag_S-0.65um_54_12]
MVEQLAVGLDVGGTKILGGLVRGADGHVLAQIRLTTPLADGSAEILRSLVAAVQKLKARADDYRSDRIVGIGVASAGHVDWESGEITDGTPNIPGWAGTSIAANINAATGLPVCCDNDGNAAAWGEAWIGAGQGKRSLVAITLGTGFGAGIYDRGHLLRGERGGGAELGHIILVPDGRPCNCGQQGCVEAYVSGTAISRQAQHFWGPTATTQEVFSRARMADPIACELTAEFARYLALALLSIFNICDPEVILLGGGIAAQADLFLSQVRSRLNRILGGRRWSGEQIQIAALGERAGMIGAAGQAIERFGLRHA